MLDSYLETLPEAVLSRLFASPPACIAVLRMLPPLAKSVVMRLLYAPEPLLLNSLESFLGSLSTKHTHPALARLRGLKILKERIGAGTVELHSGFKTSLQAAITCGPANYGFEETGSQIDVQFLAEYHSTKWETMLHFLVRSADTDMIASTKSQSLSPAILELLVRSRLLGRQNNITSEGFQFLLQPRYVQIWTLLLHYLHHAAALDVDPIDILNFLFRLSTLELGSGQSVETLPVAQKRLVNELAELGVVYLHNNVFYATVELSNEQLGLYEPDTSTTPSSNSATSLLAPQKLSAQGFIIMETNYRVYAYTSSPLQISILALFCSLKARFANLVVGRLTRHSARKALQSGISADQIIQYLSSNHKGGNLPPMIIDQIKLWQLEMDRFTQVEGVLFKDFTSIREYTAVSAYASDIGALLWKSDKTRMFFVDEKSAQDVSTFVAAFE